MTLNAGHPIYQTHLSRTMNAYDVGSFRKDQWLTHGAGNREIFLARYLFALLVFGLCRTLELLNSRADRISNN